MNPAISQAACELQVEALRAARPGEGLFMWTITAPVSLSVTEWSRRFADFIRRVSDVECLGMIGIRVWEWHPGPWGDGTDSHGVHAHLIVAGWYPVQTVRYIARVCGLGRVHVTKRLQGEAYKYAIKYVAKCRADLVECLKGRRVWASFGISGLKRRARSLFNQGHELSEVAALLQVDRERVAKWAIDGEWIVSRGLGNSAKPLPHVVRCRDIVVDSLMSRACKVVKQRAGLEGLKMLQAAQGVAWYALAYDDLACGAVAYENWRAGACGRWLTGNTKAHSVRADYSEAGRRGPAPRSGAAPRVAA